MSEKLKTLADLMNMKKIETNVFSNAYNLFFENLANNVISKLNGKERNEQIIKEYDKEAQLFIRFTLHGMLSPDEE